MNPINQVALLLLASASFPLALQAQSPSAVQQAERTQRMREIQAPAMKLQYGESAPELYPGENLDVGPQRILVLKPRRTNWEVIVDSQYLWSDNVTLTDVGEIDSTIWVNTFQAAYAPTGHSLRGREILPRVGVRAQWYNYGLDGSDTRVTPGLDLSDFDFHAQTLFADVRYNFAPNWYAHLGLDVMRLTDQDDYDEFHREVAPNWGLVWRKVLAANKLFSVGYRGYYHFAETDRPLFSTLPETLNERTDHSLTLMYLQEVCPKLVISPFYRFQFTHYTGGRERDDFLHTVGVAGAYHFTQWLNVRVFFGYETKDSGDETILPDYDKWDLGGGATLNFQF